MVALKSSARHEDSYDDYADSNYEGGLHFSPGLAPTQDEYGSSSRREIRPRRATSKRRSFGREVLRVILCGLVIGSISAAAFASQYGAPETIRALKALRKKASHLSLELGIAPSLMTVSRPASVRSSSSKQDQPEAAPPAATAASHLQSQLDAIANDVANVKGLVEQLAGSQRQIAAQVAAVKATSDASSERTWWLAQSAAYNSPPSKSSHKVAHSSPPPSPTARP